MEKALIKINDAYWEFSSDLKTIFEHPEAIPLQDDVRPVEEDDGYRGVTKEAAESTLVTRLLGEDVPNGISRVIREKDYNHTLARYKETEDYTIHEGTAEALAFALAKVKQGHKVKTYYARRLDWDYAKSSQRYHRLKACPDLTEDSHKHTLQLTDEKKLDKLKGDVTKRVNKKNDAARKATASFEGLRQMHIGEGTDWQTIDGFQMSVSANIAKDRLRGWSGKGEVVKEMHLSIQLRRLLLGCENRCEIDKGEWRLNPVSDDVPLFFPGCSFEGALEFVAGWLDLKESNHPQYNKSDLHAAQVCLAAMLVFGHDHNPEFRKRLEEKHPELLSYVKKWRPAVEAEVRRGRS